jgi:DNA-binding transcriptional ArsR family regulator
MGNDMLKTVAIFKALACETRLKIVIGLIKVGGLGCINNVNLMSEMLGIAQPNVSQHIAILKNAGIIKGYRKGTQICYEIVDQQTKDIIKALKLCMTE